MIIDERLTLYIDTLAWDIPEYLRELEKEAVQTEVPVIRRATQSFLQFWLRMMRPENILEIGTAVGFSSMLMSEAVPQSAITTIEKVPMRLEAARRNFRRFGKEKRIRLIEGDAAVVLQELVECGAEFDFIFMDAAKGQYMNFLPAIEKLLTAEGVLITDNVLQDGDIIQSRFAVTRRDRTIHGRMREFLYYLTHSEGWDTVILPIGDGIALSRRLQKEESDVSRS